MDNRPIGVFSSGAGGLAAVRELRKLLPDEEILYLSDTERLPYSARDRESIRGQAEQAIRFLLRRDVKAVVAASGAVSAVLSDRDAAKLTADIPYTSLVQPAVRRACALSVRGRLGVIAAPVAIRSGAYGKAVRAIAPGVKLFGSACPLFAPLAENGITAPDQPIARLAVEMYLAPLQAEDIDTLILGSTHCAPFFDLLGEALGYEVTLIDACAAAAGELHALLCAAGLLALEGRPGGVHCFDTAPGEDYARHAQHILGGLPAAIERVDRKEIERP